MVVKRYEDLDIAAIWQRPHELKIWYRIWSATANASAKAGLVSSADAAAVVAGLAEISSNPDTIKLLVARTDTIEATTQHNIIAATRALSEQLGPETRIIHKGMTSSDVLDTCFSLQLRQSGDLILGNLNRLLRALEERAYTERSTLCMGRTHGMDAEPTTVGLWLGRHLEAFSRERVRLKAAIQEASVCKISGAVGTYDLLPPQVEADVAAQLGLRTPIATSQIIDRSHYVPVFASLASIMACVAALATNIRNRAKSTVMEVQEPFGKGQKGSSAMPHKKNPILCENLCGLARTVIAMLPVALENVVSWEERDISHSSAERVIGPDMFVHTGYALQRLTRVIQGLVIYPARMAENLNRSPWWTGRLMDHAIVHNYWSREQAYDAVQDIALAVLRGDHPNLATAVKATNIAYGWNISDEDLARMAKPEINPGVVDKMFERLFDLS